MERERYLLEKVKEKLDLLNTYRPIDPVLLKQENEYFKVEFVYNSNAIEGNTLTLRETDLLLNEKITVSSKSFKEHLDIINYSEAYDFVREKVQSKTELDIAFIKDLHYLSMYNDNDIRGKFKEYPNMILGAEFETTPPFLVEEALENLLDWYNSSQENILIKIAQFHRKFEKIHPFQDGNGRVGRLIINFELMKSDYQPINIKYAKVEKYYEALERNTINELVMEYELEELNKLIRNIEVGREMIEKMSYDDDLEQ